MQRNRTYILALLYAPLIISNVYSNFIRAIGLSAVTVLKTIAIPPITGFFLKSFYLSYNRSIRRLYIARAINILSTAGLLL